MSFLAWALESLFPLVLASFGFILSPFLHLGGFFPKLGVELGGAGSLSLRGACVWLGWTEVRAMLTLVLN